MRPPRGSDQSGRRTGKASAGCNEPSAGFQEAVARDATRSLRPLALELQAATLSQLTLPRPGLPGARLRAIKRISTHEPAGNPPLAEAITVEPGGGGPSRTPATFSSRHARAREAGTHPLGVRIVVGGLVAGRLRRGAGAHVRGDRAHARAHTDRGHPLPSR